ncbi:MAG: DNA repair protein RecN [Eubacteriales bacterium]
MLKHLHIRNIALIDELDIDFSAGLNVLSGETGAGKSIIVDALNLVLGERADRELIKAGTERANVEAVFSIGQHNRVKRILQDNELEDMGDELVLSRALSMEGKNVCRVNGTLVTLTILKSISDLLVDIHGQHEHQTLMHQSNHIDFLDRYGWAKIKPLKQNVKKIYKEYSEIERSISLLGGNESERERSMDLLRFQIDEITSAALKPDEEETLIEEKKKMQSAENVIGALSGAYGALFEGLDGEFAILDKFKDIINLFEKIKDVDEKYQTIYERLNEAYYLAEETGMDIRSEKDEYFFDPEALVAVEERINEINQLKRKYGRDIDEIFAFLKRSETEYDRLTNAEEQLGILTEKINEVKDQLYSACMALSYERKMTAKVFERAILAELSDLGMSGAGFEVYFNKLEEKEKAEFSADGLDKVAFYITLNPGQPLKPLSKVASGGEISRIMLSFKNILGRTDVIQTNVFDEIDTGISGLIGNVVAEKLASIATMRQVICVTHLAQIAAYADKNFLIEKTMADENTTTATTPLDEEGKIREVARLAGGNDSDLSLQHAREMINQAKNKNNA